MVNISLVYCWHFIHIVCSVYYPERTDTLVNAKITSQQLKTKCNSGIPNKLSLRQQKLHWPANKFAFHCSLCVRRPSPPINGETHSCVRSASLPLLFWFQILHGLIWGWDQAMEHVWFRNNNCSSYPDNHRYLWGFRNRRQMHCLVHSDCKFNALDNEVVLGGLWNIDLTASSPNQWCMINGHVELKCVAQVFYSKGLQFNLFSGSKIIFWCKRIIQYFRYFDESTISIQNLTFYPKRDINIL